MIVKEVDLYSYFKVERPSGAMGYLKVFLLNQKSSTAESRKHPAMLVIPGGGYYAVSEREAEPIALNYLANDYNAFILNYSVAPVKFPAQLIEGAMAMAYIRENAEELNVNAKCVGAVGFSAGGHLLGMISTMFDRCELDFLKDKKSYVKPDASLFIYPVVSGVEKPHLGSFENLIGENYESRLEEFSIDKNVSEKCSPAFIVSTFKDGGVPCKNSLLLASAYENYGVPFALHVFTNGGHGLSTAKQNVFKKEVYEEVKETTSKDFYKWIKLSINWLEEIGFESID